MKRILVTGASGFLGEHLVSELCKETDVQISLLLRNTKSPSILKKVTHWNDRCDFSSVSLISYDLLVDDLQLSPDISFKDYDHVFHLAAVYDLASTVSEMNEANVLGTNRLLRRLEVDEFAGVFHFVSSIAVAGDFKGKFDETMFDEGQRHQHPYHRSKFESEKLVRQFKEEKGVDVRIYRPSSIVGHSETGYINKLDGPYYGFMLISLLKRWIPAKVPLVLPKTKISLDIVPVDYVAKAIACIGMLPASEIPSGQYCFHLSDPKTPSISEVFTQVLAEADGPGIGFLMPIDPITKLLSSGQFKMLEKIQAIKLMKRELFKALDIPETVLEALMPGLKFQADNTLKLLARYDIAAPAFKDYVATLWHFYQQNLDPQKHRLEMAKKKLRHKKILITGGSSGIGFESAKLVYSLGAEVILVARDSEKLKQCAIDISAQDTEGGRIHFYACDLSDLSACDELVQYIEENFTSVDIVFSNAGRSIRRSLSKSVGRFHDLQRTMQLNYFGAARVILGLIPSMRNQGGGHVIHSSSMGTLSATPRFGPYMASKAALDTLMDSMAAEFSHSEICFSSIKFPLVKTPMVAPTQEFKESKLTTPEQAAQMFLDVVLDKNRVKAPGTAKLLSWVSLISPNFMTQLYNYGYKAWPDEPEDFPEMSLDRMLLKYFLPHSPL